MASVSLAENLLNDQKNENDVHSQSGYRSSPRLNYHSYKPVKEEKGFGKNKPMFNQGMGNTQLNSPASSVGNSGTEKRNF
jgi:hypothetical protein